jgi:hypothetical protein
MRHSKGTKVTKDEYYVIKTALDHGTTTQAKISHDFRRSPYTLKRIKDSKSYNDYLWNVNRGGEMFCQDDLDRFSGRMYPEFDKNKHTVPFNCSVNGYDDEDVEWEVKPDDFSIIQDQITEVQDKIDVLDERIDKVYSLIKRIDRAISYIWR